MAADRIAEDNKKWKKKPGKQEICFTTSGSYGKCFLTERG